MICFISYDSDYFGVFLTKLHDGIERGKWKLPIINIITLNILRIIKSLT